MTLTGNCNKHNFMTPSQYQANILQGNTPKVNIHQLREQTLIQETVKAQDNPSRLSIYASFAEIKATISINVSLQQILCSELKRHFNVRIIHMMLILIKNGPKERIMIIINSLFNKRGSWCH